MSQSKTKNTVLAIAVDKQTSVNKFHSRIKDVFSALFNKFKTFEIDKVVPNWWRNQPAAAKTAFLSGLIIGFISHLFIYTGRYYGRDDMGTIIRLWRGAALGRWFNTIITDLNYGYILPLISGIFVTLFLALGAFYICKLFNIQKKFNAILIAGLLVTFPSVANTNLFLYETSGYHFAALLGVLAVYITVRFRFGFFSGAILIMLSLAIYQSMFSVVLVLSLFYLISFLLDENFNYKEFVKKVLRIVYMGGLGAIFYAVSIPISFRYYNTTFNNYRGFSSDSMMDRLLSVSGFKNALISTYKDFYDGFFGNIYLIVDALKCTYIAVAAFALLFLLYIIISKKIYKQYLRLIAIVVMIVLVPFASNFSNFFAIGNAYGLMIYAFVLTPVFIVVMSEKSVNIFPLVKSIFTILIILVIAHYIIGNNVYYLKAHFFNQRTFSLTTRILAKIDPLIPLSDSKYITFFGGLPNEYYRESNWVFREYGTVRDGSALGNTSYINYDIPNNYSLTQFATNINRLHGVRLNPLNWGERWSQIGNQILDQNMPVWPAEGSVGIIDDVIVVNFGLTDVVFDYDETGQFFLARHWISDGHAQHNYEYYWQVYQNGILINSPKTNIAQLYLDMPNTDDNYRVTVAVKNVNTRYVYPKTEIELPAGSYKVQDAFTKYLGNILNNERIVVLSVKDEASKSLSEAMQISLHLLGLRERLIGMHRYSYAAIIDGYNVIFEQISNEKISHTETIGDFSIELISAGFSVGNVSSIVINSEEYSLNKRGINIVVLNKSTGEVIDSVAFDTFSTLRMLSR